MGHPLKFSALVVLALATGACADAGGCSKKDGPCPTMAAANVAPSQGGNAGEVGTGCVVGVDCSPPMGWRSWNTFFGDVTQDLMTSVMDVMVAKHDDGVSLASAGYSDVGLDDNYQSCNKGVNGTFHDWDEQQAAYVNLIRDDTFPDMKAMNDYAHSLGLTSGFYENNCICSEGAWDVGNEQAVYDHYRGDVADVVAYGYDSVKLDGCGPFLNLTLYQELLNATGKYFLIENCHWGGTVPTLDWCPWSYFRSSGDIQANWASMFSNLQTTIPYQDKNAPLSRPGCWAYPVSADAITQSIAAATVRIAAPPSSSSAAAAAAAALSVSVAGHARSRQPGDLRGGPGALRRLVCHLVASHPRP